MLLFCLVLKSLSLKGWSDKIIVNGFRLGDVADF